LTNCDKEPIHIPGLVQPHGVLLVMSEPTLTIQQVSANTETHLGLAPDRLLGQPLQQLLAPADLAYLHQQVLPKALEGAPHYLPTMTVGRRERRFEGLLHRRQGLLLLELEAKAPGEEPSFLEMYAALKSAMSELEGAPSIELFCQRAAAAVRRFIGFDRVLIYKFLEDEAGRVIAEDKRLDLASYLGLHYPASDIPKQARALYLKNWLRFKVDNDAPPVTLLPALNPQSGAPLDMSFCVLRSMSPVHTEYLRNMGVQATMSLSIIRDNQLWGLVACHHTTPRYVPHAARMAAEFLAHLLSLQMGAKEDEENHAYVTRLNAIHTRFVERMSGADHYRHGLMQGEPTLLDWLAAGGIAFCHDDTVELHGQTPDEATVRAIVAWLAEQIEEPIYATHTLAQLCPAAADWVTIASGLLALRLSRFNQEYILWFRPEYKHAVNWAGDPTKPVEAGPLGDQLTPRKSFALWQEAVASKAAPWQKWEIEAAALLRRSILEIILRRAEELARLNTELERSNLELDSFAYIASHDLKEPLRGIHNYSYFLLEDYADKLDTDGVDKLQTLIRLTQRMETLIDSLLYYSRLGRQQLALRPTDLNQVLAETLELLAPRLRESGLTVRLPRSLPTLPVDAIRVGELFNNLITNAIKYNDKGEKWVEIGWMDDKVTGWQGGKVTGDKVTSDKVTMDVSGTQSPGGSPLGAVIFYVRDNGIGIAPHHHEEIFRIFRRLHGREDYGGGVGVGLTIVKKIVERHGGRLWVESTLGEGTTFYFTLAEGVTPS
jgi:light-regulated signal transduction histidine kinase (bacteriophytochrome)